jgi:hypothetical protein
LTVLEYNSHTGKLTLDMSETSLACIKLHTLQDTLVGAIVYHQHGWFKTDFTTQEVKAGFQPIFQNNSLLLHCPLGGSVTSQGSRDGVRTHTTTRVPVYDAGTGWRDLQEDDLHPGKRIRIAVKFHGISFLNRGGDGTDGKVWSGKCRIQHRIQGIVCMNT